LEHVQIASHLAVRDISLGQTVSIFRTAWQKQLHACGCFKSPYTANCPDFLEELET